MRAVDSTLSCDNEVRSLIEGGCNNRGISPCIFVCNECVAFCAQINADTVGNATSPQNLAVS